jgi:ribose 5-phosphate isomerase B
MVEKKQEKKIYLGADHKGYTLKEKLKQWLTAHGYEVIDVGARRLERGDDYPDYALAVANQVASDPEHSRGILVCDTGVGMVIAANKVPGARAALVCNATAAALAREHNNANIVVLAAEFTTPEAAADYLQIFLQTEFSGADRHQRRLRKIADFERKMLK